MNDYAFTKTELQTMIYAPPVALNSVDRCAKHRETLLLSLEKNHKEELDMCLASMLNTNAARCVPYIAQSGLGVVVKDIALTIPAEVTKTAKRLALLLTHEWMSLIRAEHRHGSAPGSPTAGARGIARVGAS
jgi:hypothetical protein